MSKFALPLQLLLALALVLNGVGGAMAGALLPAAGAPDGGAHAPQAASAGDCGGHDQPIAAFHADAPPPSSSCHSAGDADCGAGVQCLQACLHVPVAMTPLFAFGVQARPADAILHPLASGHPAPPRPSPIRPPIA